MQLWGHVKEHEVPPGAGIGQPTISLTEPIGLFQELKSRFFRHKQVVLVLVNDILDSGHSLEGFRDLCIETACLFQLLPN